MRAGRREAVTFGAPNSSQTASAIRCSHSRLTWPHFAWPIIRIINMYALAQAWSCAKKGWLGLPGNPDSANIAKKENERKADIYFENNM